MADSALQCTYCDKPLVPFIYILPCGHRLHAKCLQEIRHSQSKWRCSKGETKCKETDIICNLETVRLDDNLNKKQVFCGYQEFGCNKKMPFLDRQSHMKNCDFKPIYCANKSNGCKVRFPKRSFKEQHQICEYELLTCKFCKKLFLVKDKLFHEANCILQGKRSEEEEQIEDQKRDTLIAELEHKNSATKEYLTDLEENLKQLPQLEENQQLNDNKIQKLEDSFHQIKMLQNLATEQDFKLDAINSVLSETSTIGSKGLHILKIRSYAYQKLTNPQFESLPFHTSPYGYKVCCVINLNDNQNLRLSFMLLKDEYDSIQKWPFVKQVSLKLMDQKAVGQGRQEIFTVNLQKPHGRGTVWTQDSLCVPSEMVECNRSGYLVNDEIYLRIEIHAVVDTECLPGNSNPADFPDTPYEDGGNNDIISSVLDTRAQD